MGKKRLLFWILMWGAALALTSQTFDYRTVESPAVSWSGIFTGDARYTGMGGISLTMSGSSAQSLNPANFETEKSVEIGFSYGFLSYQAFQYWGLNEGVAFYPEPLTGNLNFPSAFSFRFGFGKSAFTLGWYRDTFYEFPGFAVINEYDFDQSDSLDGRFSGIEETFYLAGGIRLSEKLSAGLKVEYRRGTRKAEIRDLAEYYYFIDGYWQLMEKRTLYSETSSTRIIIPELGLVYRAGNRFSAGLRIRYPLRGTAERDASRSLLVSGEISIYDRYTFRDDYLSVPRISLALLHRWSGIRFLGREGDLVVAAEAEYRKWSEYRFEFYGEEIRRDLSDTVLAVLGAEYGLRMGKWDLYLRGGFGLDRQPTDAAGVTLTRFSGGAGIRSRQVEAGVAAMWVRGKTADIAQEHVLVCATLSKVL